MTDSLSSLGAGRFLQALDAAQPSLRDALSNPGFMATILVPSDAAFEAALQKHGEAWLAGEVQGCGGHSCREQRANTNHPAAEATYPPGTISDPDPAPCATPNLLRQACCCRTRRCCSRC